MTLADGELWRVDVSDNLPWLRGLPTGYAAMTLTSPPYVDCRTYGVGFRLKGEAWVSWMIPRVVEMCRVTNGLVFVNMAGKVASSTYHPVVEWLVADLTRYHGVVCGPQPYCFFRFGIPGSGGPHYHRRDWEPVYAFARPECLPPAWSDNTATGHAPKWAPGGECSHRLSDGKRVNQWGPAGSRKGGGDRIKHGVETDGNEQPRPSHVATTRNQWGMAGGSGMRRPDGTRRAHGKATRGSKNGDTQNGEFTPPAVANAGNVIRECYDAEQVRQMLMGGELNGRVAQGSPLGDVIRCVVGGNNMGHRSAHKNEAPFPEALPEYLIRSYAPEGAVVLDPHAGSGTTLAVALKWGRRALGCELREEQADNARRRVAEYVNLFS